MMSSEDGEFHGHNDSLIMAAGAKLDGECEDFDLLGEDLVETDSCAIVDSPRPRRKKSSSLLDNNKKATEKCGVCYLSRIPPRMDPSTLRQNLSRYGEIGRIYLAPEDPADRNQQTRSSRFRGKGFSEGWVEFAKKSVAKRIANMLNGEQMCGKRRSIFYYDIWNIRFLSKFTWHDLISEKAEKSRAREQKLAMEISAARKERDFYLSKVDQAQAMKFFQERLKKKQGQESESEGVSAPDVQKPEQKPKKIRRFPQNLPVVDGVRKKPRVSMDTLTELLGGS